MAKATTNVIMISIHPEYAKAIFSGGKKIEFRKLNIPKTVDHVVLYVTAPEQKIVGYFSIKKIIEDKPSELWRKFSNISGTTLDFFNKYYNNQKLGLGLLVNQVQILENPFTLDRVGVATKPPQSFLYIDNRVWKNLKRRKKRVIFETGN
ncbi:ASCH domain-containing protein [Desulfobacterota bacterium M19]